MPKISIIIPSYNEEKNISTCLDSVIKQTFSDLEVICVDDNSTDSTRNIITQFSENDRRIKLFLNPDKGVSSARNFGIAMATGEYIGFVDSDDFIQPQMYEFLYKAIVENNADMSVCGYERNTDFTSKLFEYKVRECWADDFVSFTDENYIINNEMKVGSVCSKLISKEFLSDNIRFKNYSIGEDTVFSCNLWSKSNKTVVVDLPLYGYRVNQDSVTHSTFSDIKWLDMITTRFVSYDLLFGNNTRCADFYLRKGFYYSYFLNFFSRKSENKSLFRKKSRYYTKKYFIPFMKSKNIVLFEKIKFIIFYYIPITYIICRKHFYGDEV